MIGQAFRVMADQGNTSVTYRCPACQHEWTDTLPDIDRVRLHSDA
jgi:hypothetical protein